MNYNIVKAINMSINNAFLGQERYYVIFAEGPATGTRENITGYDTEEKAKRRIRDLKRKENEEAAAHCAMEQEYREMEHADAVSAAIANDPEMREFDLSDIMTPITPEWFGKHPAIVRQVGCYPAISKHAYRR